MGNHIFGQESQDNEAPSLERPILGPIATLVFRCENSETVGIPPVRLMAWRLRIAAGSPRTDEITAAFMVVLG